MSVGECECPAAGYCQRHQRQMSAVRHDECRNKPGYYEAFQRDLERARNRPPETGKPKPRPSGPSLERLATYLTPGSCKCDRADRYAMIRNQLAKWPKPDADNGQWAVAVTTAPRKAGDLSPCLDSLAANGWRPTIFAEPGCDLPEGDVRENAERLGCWRNWRHAARTLLDETAADLFLLVQDDTVIVPGARQFLDDRLAQWPGQGTAAFVSLYTPSHYLKGQSPGCHRVTTKSMWGACAMVFRRADLEALLSHPIAVAWNGARFRTRTRPREPWEVANVDTLVGKVANDLGRGMFFYTPSLSQHVAPHSSIGHGDDSGRRAAASVVSDWSVFGGPPKTPISCPPRAGVTRLGVYYGTTHVGGAEVALRAMLRNLPANVVVSGIAYERSHPGVPKLDFAPFSVTADAEAVAANSDVMLMWSIHKVERIRRRGLPLVYVSHSQNAEVSGTNARLAPLADFRFAVSETARLGLPPGYQFDAEIIPNGIEPMALPGRAEARLKLGISNDQLAVCYVGRWHDEKNPLAAARAVAEIPQAVALYHGYRKGRDARAWVENCRSVARGRAIFRAPADGLAETYAAADVFVHVPSSEAFGLCWVEAMAAGVPVVATNRGVIAECGADVAELVEPDADGPTLAAAVQRAISNRDRTARAVEVAGRYSAATMGRQWGDALTQIADEARVPGFFGAEMRRTYRLAARSFRPGAVAVEIGSYLGASTRAMATPGVSLYAVDTWRGTPGEHEDRDYFPAFLENVAGLSVTPIRGRSPDAAAQFADGSIDFLFVDADHSYEAVRDDIAAWLPKCRGVISGHDFSTAFPGVVKAVRERFGERAIVIGDVWAVQVGTPETFDAADFMAGFGEAAETKSPPANPTARRRRRGRSRRAA